jgi:H+-translocating NAD(P) transhydrogenase subunit beta
MPVCEVWKAKRVFVNKRGDGAGYAGLENPLFFHENTRMFYGDANPKVKELIEGIAKQGGIKIEKSKMFIKVFI